MQPPPPPSAPPPASYGYPQTYGSAQQPVGWTPPPPISSRKWWFWGCGGCAAIALVAIALFVFFIVRIFTSSPLRQFPSEAGARTTDDNFTAVNNQTTETLLIVDSHSLVDVQTYYEKALNANGWNTGTHDPSQASSGDQWNIGRTGSGTETGTVTFTTVGSSTDISVVFHY